MSVLLGPDGGCKFTLPHEVAAVEALGRPVLLLLLEFGPIYIWQALQSPSHAIMRTRWSGEVPPHIKIGLASIQNSERRRLTKRRETQGPRH